MAVYETMVNRKVTHEHTVSFSAWTWVDDLNA